MVFLTQSVLFLTAVLLKARWGLILFVFLLAFSPRTAALALGAEGFALTFQRVASLCLVGYFTVRFLMQEAMQTRVWTLVGQERFVRMLALLALAKLLITVFFADMKYLVYAIDDIILSLGMFVIFAGLTWNSEQFHQIVFGLCASVVVSGLLGVVEMQLGRPLLQMLIHSEIGGAEQALAGRVRDGSYRLQVFFDNPLSLTEFAVYVLPFAIMGFFLFSGLRKIFFMLAIASAVFLIYGSGSRSGVIAGVAAILSFFMGFHWSRFSARLKVLLMLLFAAVIVYALVLSADAITQLGQEGLGAEFWRYDEKERSSLSRALQYFEVFGALSDSNLLGVGMRQNYTRELEAIRRLDNYYLRLLLEGGVLAIVFFVALVVSAFKKVANVANNRNARDVRLVCAGTAAFLVAFVIMKLFISMPTNNVYFFALIGAFYGMVRAPGLRLAQTYSRGHLHARSARP